MKLAIGIAAGGLLGLLLGLLLGSRYSASINPAGIVVRCDGWTGRVCIFYPSVTPEGWYVVPDVSFTVATNR